MTSEHLAVDADGQATTSSTVPEASCNRPTSVTSATPMTPELVSMTGESLGSLSEEFETLSFADETGPDTSSDVHLCTIVLHT